MSVCPALRPRLTGSACALLLGVAFLPAPVVASVGEGAAGSAGVAGVRVASGDALVHRVALRAERRTDIDYAVIAALEPERRREFLNLLLRSGVEVDHERLALALALVAVRPEAGAGAPAEEQLAALPRPEAGTPDMPPVAAVPEVVPEVVPVPQRLAPEVRVLPRLQGTEEPAPENLAVAVQQELARLGCYRMSIDGMFGPGSRRALQDFLTRSSAPQPASLDPTEDLWRMLRGYQGQICPDPPAAAPAPPPPQATQPQRQQPAQQQRPAPQQQQPRAPAPQAAPPAADSGPIVRQPRVTFR